MKITNDIIIEGNLIKNSKIRIRYKGKFINEFSNQVFIIYGYGIGWKEIQEQKMKWNGQEFIVEIFAQESGELNFCFRNDFGIWDNNSGKDYSLIIEPNKNLEENNNKISLELENDKQKITEENNNSDKKSRYKRFYVPEKEYKETKKLKDTEESLFEYINNFKKNEDKYFDIDSIENEKKVKKINSSKNITKIEGIKKDSKKVKKKKSKIKKIIKILCLLILLICLVYYIINLSKIKNIQDENKNLLSVEIDESFLKDGKNRITERMLQVQELSKQYPELKAWIEIKDTVINYPVMQRNDNSFYVNHNYKKEYSKWGALFLDKDFDWSIPSSNLLIYGHNFSDGLMFADLLKYRDEEFYNNHKTIRFTTKEEDVEYDILAVFNSRVYYKSEQNVFRYYFFVDAETEEEFDEYVDNAKKASIYKNDIEAEYGDQLLTLSTCDYSQADGRFVVVARKINE